MSPFRFQLTETEIHMIAVDSDDNEIDRVTRPATQDGVAATALAFMDEGQADEARFLFALAGVDADRWTDIHAAKEAV